MSRDLGVSLNDDEVSSGSEADIASDVSLNDDTNHKDVVVYPANPLGEDVYSATIASLVADFNYFTLNRGMVLCLKLFRLLAVVTTLFIVLALQLFLTYMTKHLVSPQAVSGIRETYSDYEKLMYTDANNVSHTYLTSNGFERGISGFLNEGNFDQLDDKAKDQICQVPLSQPVFLFTVLLIWSLTVVSDIRTALFWMCELVCATPTVRSMRDAVQRPEGGESYEKQIVGLTCPLKMFIIFCITLPRLFLDGFLLWLGCRWLTATVGFGDLLLNAVALEFILMLNELFFKSVLPVRLQVMTTSMSVAPRGKPEGPGLINHFAMFLVFVFCVLWCVIYMCWAQHVLPDYNWDIHEACLTYLREALEATGSPQGSTEASAAPSSSSSSR